MSKKILRWPAVAVAILSMLAVFEWPYGYYQFLRLSIFAALAYYLHNTHKQDTKLPAQWMAIGLGLLFNPFFPVHLDRSTWAIFNLICAGYFFWVGHIVKNKNSRV